MQVAFGSDARKWALFGFCLGIYLTASSAWVASQLRGNSCAHLRVASICTDSELIRLSYVSGRVFTFTPAELKPCMEIINE